MGRNWSQILSSAGSGGQWSGTDYRNIDDIGGRRILADGARRASCAGTRRHFVVFTIAIRGDTTLNLNEMTFTTQPSTRYSRRNPAWLKPRKR
jgi:hypothetical protein